MSHQTRHAHASDSHDMAALRRHYSFTAPRYRPDEIYEHWETVDPDDRRLIETEFEASHRLDRRKERSWYCVALRRTTTECYISTGMALNVADADEPMSGDWHKGSWSTHKWEPQHARAKRPTGWGWATMTCDDPYEQRTTAILGTQRLFDARTSELFPHPAKYRNEPVWCAHHERAIADYAWLFMCLSSGADKGYPKVVEPNTIDQWLWSRRQEANLGHLISQLTPHVPADRKAGWERWRDDVEQHWKRS